MADFISDLATKSGITPDLAEKGVGTILELFKDKLPADTFSQMMSAIPNANHLMDAAAEEPAEGSGGGILGAVGGAVSGAVSKLTGGGTAQVLARFTQLGFNADQLKRFLPNVMAFLKGKLPADVVKQASALLPGLGT
jgi:hypothetical protein